MKRLSSLSITTYTLLMVSVSACKVSGNRGIQIEEEDESVAAAALPQSEVKSALGEDSVSLTKFGYQILVPLNFPDRAEIDTDMKLLSISCNPAITPEAVQFFQSETSSSVELKIDATMYGKTASCKSIVVADVRGVYFESLLEETIILPTDSSAMDEANPVFDRIGVRFGTVALPQSSIIASEIAEEIKAKEANKRLLEEQAINNKKAQKELQDQINAIRVKEAEAKELEKNLLEAERKRLEAEQKLKDAELAQQLAELDANIAQQSLELAKRVAESERLIREEAERALAEKEALLAEQQALLEQLKEQQALQVDEIIVSETSVMECKEGQQLVLATVSCE